MKIPNAIQQMLMNIILGSGYNHTKRFGTERLFV